MLTDLPERPMVNTTAVLPPGLKYDYPHDAHEKVQPWKVFDESFSPPSKFWGDKEADPLKHVYIENGRRKVPREAETSISIEESPSSTLFRLAREESARRHEQEESDFYDEDVFYREPHAEFPGPYDPERPRMLYRTTCMLMQITPSRSFLKSLSCGRVMCPMQGMGPLGAKAVSVSLMSYLVITELHLQGNMFGGEGMMHIAKLVHHNETLKVLDIGDNELGRFGGQVLAAAIKTNCSMHQINATANKLDDAFGEAMYYSLDENNMLSQIDLSRNEIGIKGTEGIMKGMEGNHSVTHLDLSHNHIRFTAYMHIARMLKANDTLLILDLSWNGIGTENAKLLGMGLNDNRTLTVLAANGCRLNIEGLTGMLKHMGRNYTLCSLQIQNNPITNADLCLFVETLDQMPNSKLAFIDASSVVVTRDFVDLCKSVEKNKPGFLVLYQCVMGEKNFSKTMLQSLDLTGGDPLEALIKYARSKNLRLVDLFSRIDMDKSGSVTRQELIHGVAEMGIPLSIKQMDRLIGKLDADGDGEIDFSELLLGYKKFMRKMHKQGLVARPKLPSGEDVAGTACADASEYTMRRKTSGTGTTSSDILRRRSSTLLDKRQSSTVLDKRQSSTVLDKRQSSTLLDKRQNVTLLDKAPSSEVLPQTRRQSPPFKRTSKSTSRSSSGKLMEEIEKEVAQHVTEKYLKRKSLQWNRQLSEAGYPIMQKDSLIGEPELPTTEEKLAKHKLTKSATKEELLPDMEVQNLSDPDS